MSQDAVVFLRAWYAGGPYTVVHDREADGGEGAWRVAQFLPGQEDALVAFVALHNGRNNLYFVPNAARLGLRTSPQEEDMRGRTALVADVDLPVVSAPKDPLVLDAVTLPHERATAQAVLTALESCEPPPTAIVWSGGGYQAFWLLTQAILPEHDGPLARHVVALADTLGGDHVQNLNRLMRLPGTVNVLNAKKRRDGRVPSAAFVLHADWDLTYQEDIRPFPAAPTTTLDPLANLPSAWAERIRDGSTAHLKGKDRSRSAAVWAVICYLLRQNWTDAAVLAILLNADYGVAAHVLDQGNPEAYARRQIADARAALAKDYVRDDRGRVDADNLANISKGLVALNTALSYNEFADQYVYTNGDARPRVLDDPAMIHYRFRFEQEVGFRPTREYFREAVTDIARNQTFHPVLDYLSALKWDGVPRLETWAIEYGGAADNAYTRAVSRLILLGAVARVRAPGCKFDQMFVLESEQQGTNKSQTIEALAVRPEWYTASLDLGAPEQKVMEQMAGRWFVEFSELGGMNRSEVETVKAQLSRTTDSARPAYGHFRVDRPRSFVLWGTTNETVDYLRDDQNRRFWCVVVTEFDLAALIAVRDQLWAEAAHQQAEGASIVLPRDLWALAAAEQERRRLQHPWEEMFRRAFRDLNGHITVLETYRLLEKPRERLSESDQRIVGKIMRRLGFERVHTTFRASSSHIAYYYVRGSKEERQMPLFFYVDPVTGYPMVTNNAVNPEEIDPTDHLLGFPRGFTH